MTKLLPALVGSTRFPFRRRLSRAALVLAFAFLPALAGARSTEPSAAAGLVRAATIDEVISRWQPETHLYVLGDVGLEEDALQELADWLSDKHWTVLLVQDASGQTYTDFEGQARYGNDAIKYGTGQGIPRKGGDSSSSGSGSSSWDSSDSGSGSSSWSGSSSGSGESGW
jgi:hypothetical protein